MTSLRLIIIALIISAAFYALPALAVQRVKFPSNSDMQPPPLNVKPNFSRNVNYESRGAAQTGNDQDDNLSARQNVSDAQKDSNNFPLILGFLSAGLLIVALLATKKRSNRTSV